MPFLKSGRVAPERTGPDPRAPASQGAEPGPHSPLPTPERRPGPPREPRASEAGPGRKPGPGLAGRGRGGNPEQGALR